jgi:hypothetical protein
MYGGWVSPKAGLDQVEGEKKNIAPTGTRTPITRPSSPVTSRYSGIIIIIIIIIIVPINVCKNKTVPPVGTVYVFVSQSQNTVQ